MMIIKYIVLALLVLICSYIVYVYFHIWRQSGKPVPEKYNNSNELGRVLYYFYSPSCSACKPMKSIIAELSDEYDNLITVDIKEQLEMARSFKVRATPSFILVESNVIVKVIPGSLNRNKLRHLITGIQE